MNHACRAADGHSPSLARYAPLQRRLNHFHRQQSKNELGRVRLPQSSDLIYPICQASHDLPLNEGAYFDSGGMDPKLLR